MTTTVLIGLGSNLGDRRALLEEALTALGSDPRIELGAVSSFHETTPAGGPSGQPPFLNAAATFRTSLAPEPLLDLLQDLEVRAHRERVVRWGARTLDLDILLYGDQVIETPRLTIPHPRMATRRFALAPSAEVAPQAIDPLTRLTIAQLLARLDTRPCSLVLVGGPPQLRLDLSQRLRDAIATWIVTDLGSAPWPSPFDQLQPPRSTQADDLQLIKPEFNAPTFAVLLNLALRRAVLAGVLDVPCLLFDSTDTESIAAEVLAACISACE